MIKSLLLTAGLTGGALTFGAFAEAETQSLTALIVPALVITVLVLLNGMYVSAEFALIGSRPSRLEQMHDEGDAGAGRLLRTIESPQKQDRYIATAQLGITMATIGLGMYGEPRVAEIIEPYLVNWITFVPEVVVHSVASAIVVGFMTYLHVVVGEMVPKSLALSSAERIGIAIHRPMHLTQLILNVPVRILNGIGAGILRVVGVPPAEGHARLHSVEEIEQIVAESTEEGLLQAEEQRMIRNIFDFSERSVGQVMTPRRKVQAIPLDISREALLALVVVSAHSRFPVYADDLDHIVGILHIKDIVRVQMEPGTTFSLEDHLRPAPAVPEDQPVRKLLAAFKRMRLHLAIVLDEFGGMAGIVTLEDLIEEIVGEVRDEFDREKDPLVRVGPGVLEAAGSFLVEDLAELVPLGSEEELPDVDTLGGLIVGWLGRPPQIGDICEHMGARYSVLEIDGLAVARVRIEFQPPAGSEEE